MKSFWRWTGTIFFALVFIFLVLTGIGTSLPIDHYASCGVSYDGPPENLFAAIADDSTSARWRPDIASAVLLSGKGSTAVWRETDVYGHAVTYRTTAYAAGTTLARTIDYVPGMPYAGTWTITVSRDEFSSRNISGSGSYVTIDEDGKIYNPFFRFLARYVFGYSQSIETYLNDLGRLTTEKLPIVCLVDNASSTSGR